MAEKVNLSGREPELGSPDSKLIQLSIPKDKEWLLPMIAGKKNEPSARLDPESTISVFTAKIYSDEAIREATENLCDENSIAERNERYYGNPDDISSLYLGHFGQLWEDTHSIDRGLEEVALTIIRIKAIGYMLEKRGIERPGGDLDFRTELQALELGILNDYRRLAEELIGSAYSTEDSEGNYHLTVDEDVVDELEELSNLASEVAVFRTTQPEDFPVIGLD